MYCPVADCQPGRMFGKAEAKKEEFLNQAKAAREQRAQVKTTEHGIIKIQVWDGGWDFFSIKSNVLY